MKKDAKNDNPGDDKDPDIEDIENDKVLDEILNGKKEEEEKKDDKKDDDEENKDKNKKEFNKKLGNRTFTSEEEYDEFVKDVYNTNSRFAGEIKKLGGDPKKLSKALVDDDDDKKDDKKEEPKKELTDEERYYRIEGVRFKKQFPEANNYVEEIQVFLKKGTASINGEPSYALALAKALVADGKEVPQKLISRIKLERGEDESPKTYTKKVMKTGSANNVPVEPSQKTYSSDDLEDTSNFADQLALGKIPSF